jgi:hypothetical protein
MSASKEQLYDEVYRIVCGYLHPDSGMTEHDAMNRIIRVVDTGELPTKAAAPPLREVGHAAHH